MFNNYFPDFYYNRVEDIDVCFLKENNIKGIIFDMDNTLIDIFNRFSPRLLPWLDSLRRNNIKLIILSNSHFKNKVKKIANKLNLNYLYDAKKPNITGFKLAKESLNLRKNEIAVIGDQIFTDIVGGKKFGVKTILVRPISYFEVPIGLIKRPFEFPIIFAYKHKKSR